MGQSASPQLARAGILRLREESRLTHYTLRTLPTERGLRATTEVIYSEEPARGTGTRWGGRERGLVFASIAKRCLELSGKTAEGLSCGKLEETG